MMLSILYKESFHCTLFIIIFLLVVFQSRCSWHATRRSFSVCNPIGSNPFTWHELRVDDGTRVSVSAEKSGRSGRCFGVGCRWSYIRSDRLHDQIKFQVRIVDILLEAHCSLSEVRARCRCVGSRAPNLN